MLSDKTQSLARIVLDLINVLVAVMEEKDAAFKGHSERVASYCVQVAKKMCLDKKNIENIYPSALLHDIGLVYIPSELILRQDGLSESEQVIYDKHPLIGEKILSHVGIFSALLPHIRHHHENWDGSGYPFKLKGEAIPIEARIIRVVDLFDDLTTARPGKQILSQQDALIQLNARKGTELDPRVVEAFSGIINATFSKGHADEEGEGTIKRVLEKIIAKFKKGEVQLPVLPTIVQQVKTAIESKYTGSDEIAKILEVDAVISIRLISVANSIAFRGREKILTVRSAVPRLGTKETQSIVLAIVNKNLYETGERQLRALMEQLWKHSLACAFCCRKLAEKAGLGDLEKYFTMGLVHDIGKIPILQAITKLRNEGDASLKEMNMQMITGILRDAHTRFGAALLSGWEFDKEFIDMIQFHETPSLDDQTVKSLVVVHLANMMTRKIGLSLYDEPELVLGELRSAKILNLDEKTLVAIAEEVKQTVHESASQF